ncbi:MAG: PLDc N-terminal domain-containing protein, partial [Evtepia sp.]
MIKLWKLLVSPRFQRIGSIILIILIQLSVFALVIYRFQIYFVYFYWFCVLLSLVASIWVANGKARLPYKVAWIIPILLFPLFGGLLYFLLGGARSPAKLGIPNSQVTFREQLSSRCSPADLAPLGVELVQQAQYLNNATSCPIYNDTETQYFPSGEDLFPTLLDELSKAKKYIFLEFFIIASGRMWSSILVILLEKVKQGVRVYII